ncbi:hypothetical protein WEW_04367, partial [Escherichia coli KTE33]
VMDNGLSHGVNIMSLTDTLNNALSESRVFGSEGEYEKR